MKLLRGFASRVVLAFDADGAGQSAAGRFYEWERRLSIDVAVAALPAGSDPGEMARTDPDGLRAAIEGAKPFLQFRVERILGAAELSTPEGRARAADSALAAVAEHPDNLVRDQYLMQVAERCRLEPLLLRERLEQLRRDGPRPGGTGPQGGRSVSGESGAEGRRRGAAPRAQDDPWVREPDADPEWDADGFDGGGGWPGEAGSSAGVGPGPGGRGVSRMPVDRPTSSDRGSRPCASPSTVPRRWPTGSSRSCSATTCSGRRSTSWPAPTPSPSIRSSRRPRPRSGPCWSA